MHVKRMATLMNIPDQDQESSVILSAAKNLDIRREILRCAQNDIPDFGRYYSSGIYLSTRRDRPYVSPHSLEAQQQGL